MYVCFPRSVRDVKQMVESFIGVFEDGFHSFCALFSGLFDLFLNLKVGIFQAQAKQPFFFFKITLFFCYLMWAMKFTRSRCF